MLDGRLLLPNDDYEYVTNETMIQFKNIINRSSYFY
jgi:hypothetical protein